MTTRAQGRRWLLESDVCRNLSARHSYWISCPISGKRESPKKQSTKEIDLEQILRDCAEDNASQGTFLLLKAISNGMFVLLWRWTPIHTVLLLDEDLTRPLIKSLMHSAKRSVKNSCCSRELRLLETELYVKWLDELGYVVTAVDVSIWCLSSDSFTHDVS